MAFTFGTPATTASSGFGGFNFGSTAKTTSTSLFGTAAPATSTFGGFGGFGAKTTTATASPFSFGAAATTKTGLFGATAAAPATGGLFGSSAFGAKTTASGFGGFGTTTTTSSLFGGSAFGGPGAFGAKTTASLFGTTTSTQPLFGGTASLQQQQQLQLQQQQQQQQAALSANPLAAMTTALTSASLFGDERDTIIAKLNQLQALWGTGKAFYAQGAPPVDLCPENPFCRFKTVGYSCLPSAKDEDGFVSMDFKHSESYVKTNQQALVESLHKVLGGQASMSVCVDGVRSLPAEKSEVIVYVVERQPNGTSRRILATELYAFLSQADKTNHLKQLGVENMIAKTALSEAQLNQFIKDPPIGIDSIIWEQAKKDNPDPKNLIPVPMMAFDELLTRSKHQQFQAAQHSRRLGLISSEMTTLQEAHQTTVSKLAQYKRKHLELARRVLQVMVSQESMRKIGYGIEPSEEQLRVHLEGIQTELNAPMQYKGRLNELMSQIRLQSQLGAGLNGGQYTLSDDHLKEEIKLHLTSQQEALMQLVAIIKDDFDDLKTIETGITSASG